MTHQQDIAESPSNVVWIDPATDQSEFTIGELAREFGVTLRALRFYESKGFVTPRRDGNARLYSRNDRSRLALILTGKKLGFTLAEIRTMISGQEGAADTLRLSKEKCLEQIHLLEKQQFNIKNALAELWRIHAGLSAEIIRIDGDEQAGESRAPHRAGGM
jgi:DNA-binding transcriptional MerR regulator